jgi:flavodoxin
MNALVIYDSAFGNTAKIAQTIGDALGPAGEVAIRQVAAVEPEQLAGVNLLVVGSPTQGFRPTAAMSAFLKRVAAEGLSGIQVAAFDTRLATSSIRSSLFRAIIDMFGYAAQRIAKQLTRSGGRLVLPPEGFIVEGKEGPLMAGEQERAANWAKRLVAVPVIAH